MNTNDKITITIGEILNDYIKEYNLTQNQLAMHLKVPSNRINEIVRNRREISIETDRKLCWFFEKSPGFFYRLQNDLNVEKGRDIDLTGIPKISEVLLVK